MLWDHCSQQQANFANLDRCVVAKPSRKTYLQPIEDVVTEDEPVPPHPQHPQHMSPQTLLQQSTEARASASAVAISTATMHMAINLYMVLYGFCRIAHSFLRHAVILWEPHDSSSLIAQKERALEHQPVPCGRSRCGTSAAATRRWRGAHSPGARGSARRCAPALCCCAGCPTPGTAVPPVCNISGRKGAKQQADIMVRRQHTHTTREIRHLPWNCHNRWARPQADCRNVRTQEPLDGGLHFSLPPRMLAAP